MEKIEKVYGKEFERLCPDENGWVKVDSNLIGKGYFDKFPFGDFESIPVIDNEKSFSWRLKLLSGIEDNNGWIKIENEADFPKHSGIYHAICKENLKETTVCTYSIDDIGYSKKYWINNVIYYQPLQEPDLPIY